MRRNKKHLQQLHDSESPHTSAAMEAILGEHGTEDPATRLLSGTTAHITENDSDCVTAWRRHIAMTEAERALPQIPADIDQETFAENFQGSK